MLARLPHSVLCVMPAPSLPTQQKGGFVMTSLDLPQLKHTNPKTNALRRAWWRAVLRLFDWRLLIAPLIAYGIYRYWLHTAESGRYPAFILPHPNSVWERFQEMRADGTLMLHLEVTLREALSGLLIASVIALVLGYVIARIRLLNYVLIPYLIFLQAIPVVAVAPIIIIWVGPDIESKIVIAALITWFPLMVSTIVGIRNVSPQLREMMRANAANPFQVFWHLELPSAMPEILGGLKIAITLSVIGAAVGEFVSSREGLGYLIVVGRSLSDPASVFLGVIMLTAVSLTLYSLVAIAEYILLRWKRAGR